MKFSLVALAAASFADGKKMDEPSFRSVCPAGFRLTSSDTCTKTLTTPASMRCARGALIKGMCLSRHVSPPILSCGLNESLRMDVCEDCMRVDAIGECPEFFVLEGEMCVRRELEAGELSCEEGELVGHMCKFTETVEPEMICVEGFELVNGRCEKLEVVDVSLICEEGSSLKEDGSCWMEERRVADEVCTGIEVEGKCFKEEHTAAEQHCPFFGDANGCWNEERRPKDVICPEGFAHSALRSHFGGQLCELCRDDRHKALAKCEYRPAMMGCLGDQFFNEGGEDCIKRIYTKPTFSCSQGRTLLFGDQDGHPYCSHRVETECEKVCNDVEQLEGDECVTVMTSTPSGECPPGFVRDGERCTRTVVEEVELRCDAGTLTPENDCAVPKTSPPMVSCPADFERNSGLNCERVTTVEKSEPCPTFEYTLADGICTLCKTTTPTPSCPNADSKLIHSSKRSFCFSVSEEPAEPSCLKGWSPSGPSVCTTAVVIKPTTLWKF